MDSFKSYEDANQEGSFIMSKAVLMTCLVALIYISLVIALMLWCRHRKNKSRSEANDMEKRGDGENDDTPSDHDADENKVGIFTFHMLSCQLFRNLTQISLSA